MQNNTTTARKTFLVYSGDNPTIRYEWAGRKPLAVWAIARDGGEYFFTKRRSALQFAEFMAARDEYFATTREALRDDHRMLGIWHVSQSRKFAAERTGLTSEAEVNDLFTFNLPGDEMNYTEVSTA